MQCRVEADSRLRLFDLIAAQATLEIRGPDVGNAARVSIVAAAALLATSRGRRTTALAAWLGCQIQCAAQSASAFSRRMNRGARREVIADPISIDTAPFGLGLAPDNSEAGRLRNRNLKDPLHNSLQSVVARARAVCGVAFLANSGLLAAKRRLHPIQNRAPQFRQSYAEGP